MYPGGDLGPRPRVASIHPPSPGAVVVPGVGEVQMELRKEQTSWGNSEISPRDPDSPRFLGQSNFPD